MIYSLKIRTRDNRKCTLIIKIKRDKTLNLHLHSLIIPFRPWKVKIKIYNANTKKHNAVYWKTIFFYSCLFFMTTTFYAATWTTYCHVAQWHLDNSIFGLPHFNRSLWFFFSYADWCGSFFDFILCIILLRCMGVMFSNLSNHTPTKRNSKFVSQALLASHPNTLIITNAHHYHCCETYSGKNEADLHTAAGWCSSKECLLHSSLSSRFLIREAAGWQQHLCDLEDFMIFYHVDKTPEPPTAIETAADRL